MNCRLRVWVPPHGDSRLVRFQTAAAVALAVPGMTSVPPFLHLDPQDRTPVGKVEVGPWQWAAGEPVLAARDPQGPLGWFCMGLVPGRPWAEGDLATLPAPPVLGWTRGRLAWLNLESDGSGAVILWSWEPVSGWRSDLPKG